MFNIAVIRPFGHNVGNHAIYFSIKQMLYETFGRLVNIIEIPASSKYETTAKAGLTKETVYELNRLADGVIVGGGNLYENNEISVDHVALDALLPPLMLFSNSYGRVYNRFGRLSKRSDGIPMEKLSLLVSRANISASRDKFTTETIKSLGLEDEIGFCPTIGLRTYESALQFNLPNGENAGAFISIRNPLLMNVPAKHQGDVFNQIELGIKTLKKRFNRVRLLCNDSRDIDFALNFRDRFRVDPYYTNDIYEYLALLKNSDFVLSYRLHATLPAASFGTPVLNLSYDERANGLIKDLDLDYLNINIVENQKQLADRIKQIGSADLNEYCISTDTCSSWNVIIKKQKKLFDNFRDLIVNYQNGA